MYCKNCDKEIDNRAQVCIGCGIPAYTGTAYCHNCGEQLVLNAPNCEKCGAPSIVLRKSRLIAGLLGILLGIWGIHNFYLGQIGKGILKICLMVFSFLGYIGFTIGMVFFSMMNMPRNYTYGSYEYEQFNGMAPFIPMSFGFLFMLIYFGIYIWGIVEGIMILTGKINTDAKGIPLKD